jgi:serine/threonine protein kinase
MQNRLKNKAHFKDEDYAKIIKSILLGIQHIHKNNYIHRDIKPSNIVITDPNDLESFKIVDFGLAIKY